MIFDGWDHARLSWRRLANFPLPAIDLVKKAQKSACVGSLDHGLDLAGLRSFEHFGGYPLIPEFAFPLDR